MDHASKEYTSTDMKPDDFRNLKYHPFKHPLMWFAIIPMGTGLLAACIVYMLELPEVGLVFSAISLMLWLGWCLWLLAFALAPPHSWATPLRTRLRANSSTPGLPLAYIALLSVFTVAVPYVVFNFCSGQMIFMGKVAKEVWPESTLIGTLGLDDREFIETLAGGLCIAMAVTGVIIGIQMKRRSQEGAYQCLNCGHGSATKPEARCPECGETECFTFTAPNRSTAE